MFDHFSSSLKIVVIGASGGIGAAFVDHLAQSEKVETIFTLSRSECPVHGSKIKSASIDITDEASVRSTADSLPNDLDIIILATGILHDGHLTPEKSLNDISMKSFEAIFKINTFGPALVCRYFLPKLAKGRRSVFAALSARVGSISDNHLGGWYAYRSSKASLNMLLKTASIEMARKNDQAIVIGLHPGTVDTGLSKPFQSYVKPEKLFTPEYASEQMLNVIDKVNKEDSGFLFAYDGSRIEF